MPSLRTLEGRRKALPHRLPVVHAREVDATQPLQNEKPEPETSPEREEVGNPNSQLHPGNRTIRTGRREERNGGSESSTREEKCRQERRRGRSRREGVGTKAGAQKTHITEGWTKGPTKT